MRQTRGDDSDSAAAGVHYTTHADLRRLDIKQGYRMQHILTASAGVVRQSRDLCAN